MLQAYYDHSQHSLKLRFLYSNKKSWTVKEEFDL